MLIVYIFFIIVDSRLKRIANHPCVSHLANLISILTAPFMYLMIIPSGVVPSPGHLRHKGKFNRNHSQKELKMFSCLIEIT